MVSFTATASFKEFASCLTKCFTSNRAHFTRHSIESSKRVGYRQSGTSTKLDVMRSSTNSPEVVANNWKSKKLVGTDWSSPSVNFDKQHKGIRNEVVQPSARSHTSAIW